MCSLYGVCTIAPNGAPPLPLDSPMKQLNVTEVAAFVDSLRPGGVRDICPEGCTLPPLFNGSKFAARGVSGSDLLDLLRKHDDGLPRAAIHNDTLRAAHAGWLRSMKLFDAVNPTESTLLAFANRLRDAVRAQHHHNDRRRVRLAQRLMKT